MSGNPKALVVDDEESIRDFLKLTLEKFLQFEVTVAEDVEQALAALEKEEFDLVISDYVMPGGEGVTVYRWLEERRPERATAFFFITGEEKKDKDGRLMTHFHGAPVLRKPFGLKDLLTMAKKHSAKPEAEGGS